MRIGAQFYTIRDFCRTKEDLSESVKKVADIGYEFVQLSGTCGYEAEWMKEELKKAGVKCVLTHFDPAKISGEPRETALFHKTMGCKYVGIGGMPGIWQGNTDFDGFVAKFLPAAKILSAEGLYFMYHNHHFEFSKTPEGRLYFDILTEIFPKDVMGFTLDTYWVQYGGGDPAEWLEKLSGRVPCIHLKDLSIVDMKQRMAVIGEGNINFDRVFKAAEAAGTEYMLVEQDDCYGENPFDCLKRSYDYLKSCGFN